LRLLGWCLVVPTFSRVAFQDFYSNDLSNEYGGLVALQVDGANRHWRFPFRHRGTRHRSAVAHLSTLGGS
jgi:hypothetical protein